MISGYRSAAEKITVVHLYLCLPALLLVSMVGSSGVPPLSPFPARLGMSSVGVLEFKRLVSWSERLGDVYKRDIFNMGSIFQSWFAFRYGKAFINRLDIS